MVTVGDSEQLFCKEKEVEAVGRVLEGFGTRRVQKVSLGCAYNT